MATHVSQGPLIFKDENFDVIPKKLGVDATTMTSRTCIKKGGNVVGSCKALDDITNKSSIIHNEALSRKKKFSEEDFDIAAEMCLHDHKKCIEAQQRAQPDSPRCCPEPIELPVSEFSDWLVLSTQWNSPPSSPLTWDSPLYPPISWKIEPEFVLMEEDD